MLRSQLAYQLRLLLRNPRSAFSSLVLPALLIVLISILDHATPAETALVAAGIVVFAIVSICVTNLATAVVSARDRGVLKRLRGTPMPPRNYVTARVLTGVLLSVAAAVLTFAIAEVGFGAPFDPAGVALGFLLVAFGAACFGTVGLAVATVIPNADAAPAILSAVTLPILLLSGVFGPNAPTGPLAHVMDVFPVVHLANALRAAVAPGSASGILWRDLANLLVWTVVSARIAVRRFRWVPGTDGHTRRRIPAALGPTGGGG